MNYCLCRCCCVCCWPCTWLSHFIDAIWNVPFSIEKLWFLIFSCVFLCFAVCGVRGRENRIVGGSVVMPNEYPWIVGLWRDDLARIYCGAAIITSRHVITAAHCVNNFERTSIRVYLGGHNVTTDYTEIRRVKTIHQHEYFDSFKFDNDIAILELDKEIKFGPKVQPACLPERQFEDYTDQLAAIAGWGRTGEREPTTSDLRSVIVPIWSQKKCNDESNYGKQRLTDNMMCAGYAEGLKDACQVSRVDVASDGHEKGWIDFICAVIHRVTAAVHCNTKAKLAAWKWLVWCPGAVAVLDQIYQAFIHAFRIICRGLSDNWTDNVSARREREHAPISWRKLSTATIVWTVSRLLPSDLILDCASAKTIFESKLFLVNISI